ncbi:HBL/NHE enterotoxin family protein [Bacillus thuringiensis]|uniref:HBL/NHE enterotoxin family protein n=1 Tax=Bacillus thuringiensis TaxID=1428 RepID=UPI00164366FC|nr:HBL/NHE enterotoxin family protein [Bacillus thuringiensis]
MKIIRWNTLSILALVTTLLTSAMISPIASAQTNTSIQLQNESKQLAPQQELETKLRETNQHILVIDTYAQTVFKTPTFHFNSGVAENDPTTLNQADIDKIMADQKTAKQNARQWTSEIRPALFKFNQAIVDFGNDFRGYRDQLLEFVNQKNKVELANGLKLLAAKAKTYQEQTQKQVDALQKFRTQLAQDASNFQRDSDTILIYLKGRNTGIQALVDEINQTEESRKAAIGLVAAGATSIVAGTALTALGTVIIVSSLGFGSGAGVPLIVAGTGLIAAGIVMVVTGNERLNTASQTLSRLSSQKAAWEMQVMNLTANQTHLDSLTNAADQAVNAAQALATQWTSLTLKLETLVDLINKVNVNETDIDWMKVDIEIAASAWKDLQDVANLMNTGKVEVK